MKCPWCGKEVLAEEYSKHYEICPRKPMQFLSTHEKHSELPSGVQEWHGIKGFSAVVRDGEFKWTVKLRDVAGNYVTVTDVMSIAFEEFPGEPIPLIESIHISRSSDEAFVTGFERIYGSAVIMVGNFKGTARVRKELFSLFFFLES